MQKWVSVDPIVTKTLGKPFKFEPPASDPYNMMNYVVGFEDDASARDITRRYTKAYNAKTRKLRVESTRHGEKWWEHALKAYERPFFEDRDELEISELTSKSAAEPMPRNILDFKDHPVYALERHLRRNEVIFPKRVIGSVGLSKSGANSDTLDSIYRRSDVHTVRSADKWYRMGRDVKVGEQPLKRVNAIRPKGGATSDDETDEPEQTALYAEYQTHTYHPPPVVQGRIPKNSYGNLDVYVPSMVPPGGLHIKQPEAARAARLLGIDYADAVTGFDFKGRRGTAVFGGIVIATEHQEALAEVLRGFADDRQEALFEARSAEALRLWRLFLIKLRIAERVKGYADEDEEGPEPQSPSMSIDEDDAGGGFFPDPDQPKQLPPQDSITSESRTDTMSHAVNESSHEDDTLGGGFVPDEAPTEGAADTFVHQNEDYGGGFVTDGLQDDGFAVIPSTATNSLTSLEKAKRRGIPNASRYELVVVANHNPQGLEGSSEKAAIAVDSSTNRDSKSASVELISRPPSPPAIEPKPLSPVESDSEIEKGSLLSEDPEDEDAVPDWLMFD
jgi:xeroderma pigmentosum group C-complementing protein